MTYQPVIPLGGYTGWRFLTRTLDTQKQAFLDSAPVARDVSYFRENIAEVESVDDLMADRRLLRVALGAYGLGDDVNSGAFIRKVLEEGTGEGSFSAKLADKRYAALADAFGFAGAGGPRTSQADFAATLLGRYEDRQFERAVGEVNEDLRLALNLAPALADVTAQTGTKRGQWFAIMGNTPLRTVFETALGFPKSFGQIDIDQQHEAFRDRAKSVLGTDDPEVILAQPDLREKLIRLFTVRSEAAAISGTSSASVALSLLQSAPRLY